MPRCFEVHTTEGNQDVQLIVDLDKICLVRVETQVGRHFPHITVQFVGGEDARAVVPTDAATKFLDAYREYLKSKE